MTERARHVADAVLYEGYVLFPYRASAVKNRFRWQWGVVIPAAQHEVGHAEQPAVGCELLLRRGPDGGAQAEVTARFLRLRHRQMVDPHGAEVDRLVVDGEPVPTWDEGLEEEVAVPAISLGSDHHILAHPIAFTGGRDVEVHGAGRAVRTTADLRGEVRVSWTPLDAKVGRLVVEVANTTAWSRPRASRDEVLRRSLVGVHVLVQVRGDAAIASAIDPPAWARTGVEPRRRGLYPVLADGPVLEPSGMGGTDASAQADAHAQAATLALALPIILSDFPEVAPESTGPTFDATEVDELLALCVLGLSQEERAEARATDPRARELIDRTTTLPAAAVARLHGTVRSRSDVGLDPGPEVMLTPGAAAALGVGDAPLEAIHIDGVDVAVGSRVRLRPRRRADAQDLFLAGRVGVVERIVATDDGEAQIALTIEGDPAADLHRWYGRYHYFSTDEVLPLDGTGSAGEEAGGHPG